MDRLNLRICILIIILLGIATIVSPFQTIPITKLLSAGPSTVTCTPMGCKAVLIDDNQTVDNPWVDSIFMGRYGQVIIFCAVVGIIFLTIAGGMTFKTDYYFTTILVLLIFAAIFIGCVLRTMIYIHDTITTSQRQTVERRYGFYLSVLNVLASIVAIVFAVKTN